MIFSFFNDKRLLTPKYSGASTLEADPLHSWSDSPIGCFAPLYSRSGSLIRSAYSFLYINSCFRFNKSLTNLTSLRQHHLQYIILKIWHTIGSGFVINIVHTVTLSTFCKAE
jgi:hypothetical protein